MAGVCNQLANKWSQTKDGSEFSVSEFESLSSTQAQEFLNQLLIKVALSLSPFLSSYSIFNLYIILCIQPALSVEVLKTFESVYKMNERRNSEIRFRSVIVVFLFILLIQYDYC